MVRPVAPFSAAIALADAEAQVERKGRNVGGQSQVVRAGEPPPKVAY